MIFRLAADVIVVVHFSFAVFVVAGGLLSLKWRRLAYVHIPVALWGAWIELADWTCPLTPLENHLRRLAGESGYPGGFIEHYLVRVLYPPGLTPTIRIALGVLVIAVNGAAYWSYVHRHRPQSSTHNSPTHDQHR